MRFAPEIRPGLVSDETTFSAPGRWSDGNNVRPRYGKMETVGGWAKVIETALTGTCRNALSWLDLTVRLNIAFGTHSALMVLKGGSLYDITPSGLAAGNVDYTLLGFGMGPFGLGPFGGGPLSQYYPRTWSLATWGEYLMANPRGRTLYVWQNDVTAVATEVTQAPNNITCILVTPERQVLALGCNEETSGDYNPMCIRGCDLEDYTDWTTSPSNNAFEHILEGGGRIVSAKLFGSYVAVWTDTSVFLGQFIGDPGQTYRFDLVAENCGLSGPNAVVVVNQAAYWLTPDHQFYSWILGAPPAPVPCPIRSDFKENVDQTEIDKVVATSVSEFNEAWFFYPDTRDGNENSRYVAVSLSDNAWFRGDIARSAAIGSGPQAYPVFVSADSYVYYHENGNDADGEALEYEIRLGNLYLDEAELRVLIDGIWPDFKDQLGNITMTLYAQDHPQSSERTKGPYILAPGREKKDFLIDTRLVGVKFSGNSAPAFMRTGKLSFGFKVSGQR